MVELDVESLCVDPSCNKLGSCTLKPFFFAALLAVSLCQFAGSAHGQEVTLDASSGKAVLDALKNPKLELAEALSVAGLPGNQGLIRKANSYHIAATTETFAEALIASAHGTSLDTPTAKNLGFDRLKQKADDLAALIAKIEAHPDEFQAWVVERVGSFSPKSSMVRISGYLVVGGNSGGFAFDEPKFYLNLSYFNEFETAKVVLAHELYHAVQAVYSVEKDDTWLKPESSTAKGRARQQVCANLSNLFANLYQEGSASYVGDPMLLDEQTGPLAKKTRAELQDGLNNLHNHLTLMELSVVGLEAKKPVPFDDVYALGFYVPEPLYKLGYVMAKAIATDEGPQSLTKFLGEPGYSFAKHYVALPGYGKDRDHPKLGPNTLAAIRLLASGCKPSRN